MSASPGDRMARLGHAKNVFVVAPLKLVYVSVAKNACTSLKWVVAELAGEPVESFTCGLRPYTADEHAVHDRHQWRYAQFPDEVHPDVRAQISPDNGWFVFGVTRDPWSRLFSAWQDKFLLQDPAYRSWDRESWYPPIPETPDDIRTAFARFVRLLVADPKHRLRWDVHFAGQRRALRPDVVPFSRIYDVAEMPQLLGDLQAHVATFRRSAPGLRRSNGTPLCANAGVYPPDLRAAVQRLYQRDFADFGTRWSFDRIEHAPEWTPDALGEVQVRAQLARRLSDVRTLALAERQERQATARRVRELEAELRRLRGRSLVRRASRKLAAVVQRPVPSRAATT